MTQKKHRLLAIFLLLLVITSACQFSYSINTPGLSPTGSPARPTIKPETQKPAPQSQPSQSQAPTPELSIPSDVRNSEELLVALYERANPGVVTIQTLTGTGSGLGSGFVFDTEGHIVTNYHVVESANELEVDFPSGIKVRGNVIAVDLDSDLAVIKVDLPVSVLYPLALGDSDQMKVGQSVVAIGNPFGLSNTMTVGIVSAKGRTLDSIREAPTGGYFSAGDLIQTDASINPGNSGGPLLNLKGEVVGINRAIRTTGMTADGDPVNSGIGFAISSNIIKRVVPYLIQNGKYDYPYLGVTARETIGLLEQEALGLTTADGAYIINVSGGGPADKAGLRGGTVQTSIPGLLAGGDMIINVDGQPVHVFGDLLAYLMKNKSPGDEITLTILRNREQKEIKITLERRP